MEVINKTVMEEWAESSIEFSDAIKKLLNEFGFNNINEIKDKIRNYFPAQYLTICKERGFRYKKKISCDFASPDYMIWTSYSAVSLAKAILFASAFLETTDMKAIINWANI